MGKRIPPSARTSERIRVLLSQGRKGEEDRGGVLAGGEVGPEAGEAIKSAFVHLAVRKVIEELLEAEVGDVLQRGYYLHRGRAAAERGATDATGGAPAGYRNGYRDGRLKTAEGEIDYAAPQVSDGEEPFRSRLRALLSGRSEELERLAIEMYARGLSTRDLEDATRSDHEEALLSRTAVSEVTEKLWEEYEAFATRDLKEFDLAYLFLDGVAERLHPGQKKDAVLCAWGIDVEGRKHLLHLTPGTKEDTESVQGMIQDMKRRGLTDPLLVTTDGAGGLIAAVEASFPRADRRRCLAHKVRNIAKKVPEDRWPEFEAHVRACYQAPSREVARQLKEEVIQGYAKELPSGVERFVEDFEACIVHLKYPLGHRRTIRTTNLLERLFEEDRRRTKVLPHAFGERAMLKLMYAATIRASSRWRRIKVAAFDRAQLEAIRKDQDEAFAARHRPPETSRRERINRSPRPRISSKTGT